IADELTARGIVVPPERQAVVFRAIHASADFDYAESLVFSPGALDVARDVLSRRPVIVTDTNMARAGISAASCARLGVETCCFMADDDVAAASQRSGLTRAACAVDKAARLFAACGRPVLFACGNAPTALVRLRQLHDAGFFSPAFVVGVPVGFVNVTAAKELILNSDLPHIVARGRKGGSSVAAAIVNALLAQA
ncbi:MAG: precorrin-8X methylmutase, partial [Treponemataceae bacterium]|nr:precorrin-8X methylmutase [Treponemataceae bacterium]